MLGGYNSCLQSSSWHWGSHPAMLVLLIGYGPCLALINYYTEWLVEENTTYLQFIWYFTMLSSTYIYFHGYSKLVADNSHSKPIWTYLSGCTHSSSLHRCPTKVLTITTLRFKSSKSKEFLYFTISSCYFRPVSSYLSISLSSTSFLSTTFPILSTTTIWTPILLSSSSAHFHFAQSQYCSFTYSFTQYQCRSFTYNPPFSALSSQHCL